MGRRCHKKTILCFRIRIEGRKLSHGGTLDMGANTKISSNLPESKKKLFFAFFSGNNDARGFADIIIIIIIMLRFVSYIVRC